MRTLLIAKENMYKGENGVITIEEAFINSEEERREVGQMASLELMENYGLIMESIEEEAIANLEDMEEDYPIDLDILLDEEIADLCHDNMIYDFYKLPDFYKRLSTNQLEEYAYNNVDEIEENWELVTFKDFFRKDI